MGRTIWIILCGERLADDNHTVAEDNHIASILESGRLTSSIKLVWGLSHMLMNEVFIVVHLNQPLSHIKEDQLGVSVLRCCG